MSAIGASSGFDLSGGLVRLAGSRSIAQAQHAAAERMLELTKLGVAAEQAGANVLRAAQANISQHVDALATMATGLGRMVDVYA